MFQNVLMTVTPLSETKQVDHWESKPFIYIWPESNQEKTKNKDTVNRTIKKKNKRNRTAYTTDQLRVLEKTFTYTKYVDAERRKALADCLNIGEKCVKVWFQNRRMKEKKEYLESNNDSSSNCIKYEPITPPPVNSAQNNIEGQYVQSNNKKMGENKESVESNNNSSKECVQYISVSPPLVNSIQNSTENQNSHFNNSYMKTKIEKDNSLETQSYYYPSEQNYKPFNSAYGYHNYVPMDYNGYGMPSYTNVYFPNGAAVYPQYYPNCAAPEHIYTNVDNNVCIQNQQHTSTDIPNWSANDMELNYYL